MPVDFGDHTTDHMRHGGDIYSFPVELDFSVNTNPVADHLFEGIPASGPESAACRTVIRENYRDLLEEFKEAAFDGLKNAGCYPDLHCRKLKDALAKLEEFPAEQIVCGSGASELFMAIVHAVKPKTALVLSPCYSGYERAIRAQDRCRVVYHALKEENGFALTETVLPALSEEIDLFFLAVPNNPTGKLVEPDLLDSIREECRKKEILLVLDACFHPLASEETLSAPDAVIVKAFTKSMSVPGIRMGYLMTEQEAVRNEIEKHLPEWNVSSIAQAAGVKAAELFAESSFLEESRRYIRKERDYLKNGLSLCGLKVFESDVNYLLAKTEVPLYQRLLERKILIRDCSNFKGLGPDFVRFAVKTHEENEKLIRVIKEITEQ